MAMGNGSRCVRARENSSGATEPEMNPKRVGNVTIVLRQQMRGKDNAALAQ